MPILGTFIFPHPPLIIPEIGKGQELRIQKTIDACNHCAKQVKALEPETIVVISPHSTMYLDYFHISPGAKGRGDFRNYQAQGVKVEADYDRELVSAIEQNAKVEQIPAGRLGEREPALDHGTMIPLYFINRLYRDYRLVRIGLSGLNASEHYRLGMCIKRAVSQTGRRVILVASGDLSHKLLAEGPYGYAPEGPLFDQQVTKAMADGDFLAFLEFVPEFLEGAAECGLKSFQIMAGTWDQQEVSSELLSYEGPYGVGYGVAAFYPVAAVSCEGRGSGENLAGRGSDEIPTEREGNEGPAQLAGNPPKHRSKQNRDFLAQHLANKEQRLLEKRKQESDYVKLARYILEHYVLEGQDPSNLPSGAGKGAGFLPEFPSGIPNDFFTRKAGVFVSLKKDGQLRGCIGTILPAKASLAEEIRQNAIRAGSSDPRFDPVRPEELSELVYSVDVLAKPEAIPDPSLLDVKKYGIIVMSGKKQGLLLPDLAGVDTVEKQLQIAKQKAGIREGEAVSLARFEVVRFT